ncbi:MAG TPA: DUF4179 domain-containing protein [Metabacillus sp.]|nr:DUF4179 domain-containing protein [Metabacillus sp.]
MTSKSNTLKDLLIEERVRKDLEFTGDDRQKVFSEIHHQHIKSKRRFNFPVIIASSLSIALVFLLISTSTWKPGEESNPAAQEQIEYIDESSLFSPLNLTVEDNGIKVTVNQIMYDGSRILVGYEAVSTTDEELDRATGEYRVTINGENKGPDLTILPQDGNKEGTAVVAIELYKEFPDEFQLGLQIRKIQEQKGSWNFTIPVKKIPGDIKRFEPKTIVKKDHLQFSIKEVIASQSALKLRSEKFTSEDIDRKSPLYDKIVTFELQDPEGNEILPQNSYGLEISSFHGNFQSSSTTWFHAPKELPEYLMLKAYIPSGTTDMIHIKKSINDPLPIELSQDGENKLIISMVEEKQNQVWVYYSIDGNLKQLRNRLMLKLESDGEEQYIQPNTFLNYKPGKVNIAKFDVEYSDDLYVVTNKIQYEEFEELDTKIPLTNPK